MFLVTFINDPEALLHGQGLLIALKSQFCRTHPNGFIHHLGIRKAPRYLIHTHILLRLLLQTSLGQVETLLVLPRVLGQTPPDVADAPFLGEGLVTLHCHLVTLLLTAVLVDQAHKNTEDSER